MDNLEAAESSKSSGGGSDAPSSLDHALLESLFYNEMMLMDDTSSLSSTLLSTLAADGSVSSQSVASHAADPSTIAEKDLLRDFGVAGTPEENDLPAQKSQWGATATSSTHNQEGVSLAQNAVSAPAQQYKTDTSGILDHHSSVAEVSVSNHSAVHPVQHPLHVPNPLPVSSPPQATPHATIISEDEKRKKLVSQFATLASRLGINLPSQVLESLSKTAAVNEGQPTAAPPSVVARSTTGTVSAPCHTSAASIPKAPPPASGSHSRPIFSAPAGAAISASSAPSGSTEAAVPALSNPPPALKQLESTAEAAIAAVSETSQKRANGEATSSTSSSSNKPAYSKRRKKPRLSDCEEKLAELKAENELLKRHLHNVSNQSHKFDQERREQEQRMKAMLNSGASQEELHEVVKNFTEMYSDYGKKRHEELNFHLEQLQRLASPANFTKMGLWALGQQSKDPKRNPIAGILQRELDITPQQGRKILEQRQKIRHVCSNLKECLGLLSKLKGLCEQKTQIFHDRMSKCREILNPRQVVQLLVWIDENSDLLETVCPGWGSEQIHSKNQTK